MDDRQLAAIDLNLLTVFRAVDETRHITRAAKSLGLSQPALSHALRRLRDLFGDPLFVKTPRGMTPTPRAEAIAAPIRAVLHAVECEVLQHGEFRPSALSRTFRIRTTDYVEALFAVRLLGQLAKEAPAVRFAVTPTETTLPARELESGACDLAIAGFFSDLPSGFRHAPLFEDSLSCAVRRSHPRIGPRTHVSVRAFCEERHLLVAPSGELTGAVDRALAPLKHTRMVVAGTSGFMSGAWMAASSDCVLTAPSRLLDLLGPRLGLVRFAPPVRLPPIRVVSVWHARAESDPAHRWFRELVQRELAS